MTPELTPPDPLDALLSEWKVDREVPASLHRDVWAHIGASDVRPMWWEKLALVLLGPKAIVATVVASVAVGSGLAITMKPAPALDAHAAYVQSISPFASVHLATR